jgi:hypothetical protein
MALTAWAGWADFSLPESDFGQSSAGPLALLSRPRLSAAAAGDSGLTTRH